MQRIPKIDHRLQAIESYISRNSYKSYDPYDGLKSPLARRFVGQNQLFLRVWQQAVRLFPINIRPLLCIHKMVHTKAISDFASAYTILYTLISTNACRERGTKLLNWLGQLNSPTRFGMGWGLRFPFATRFVVADHQACNIFQTINAIHAFLDGYDAFNNERYLEIAKQGVIFAEKEIGFKEVEDYITWNYWQGLEAEIYNVSGLMIGLTARLFKITAEKRYYTWTQKLYAYIQMVQNEDGSWFYSADKRGKWVDGFHTGYILEGLCRASLAGVINADNECLKRGSQFYLDHLFTIHDMPKYYPSALYPIDIQNAAQAIQTLVFLAHLQYCPIEKILSVLDAVDKMLWNHRGYYNYLKTRFLTHQTPMHRWGTGPMFLALVHTKRLLNGKL